MYALVAAMVLNAAPAGEARPGTPDEENIVKARQGKSEQAFVWHDWSPETFALAKAQKKLLLIDCAAEWCHWCHVMDETTYRDASVGAWLKDNAIAVRVDIDERPDLFERYSEWGWPATILLSSDASELGKYRGYLPPERFLELVRAAGAATAEKPIEEPAGRPVSELPQAIAFAKERLNFYWDDKQGSWGRRLKVPMGANVLWELSQGDKEHLARAKLTLKKQAKLIDPVGGGISQYSTDGDWNHEHYEKLMTYQAPNLEAYSRAYEVTKDAQWLSLAKKLHGYMTTTLRSDAGTFFTNQDADVNAHDRSKPFVDGHIYYALNAKERAKRGSPWVDTHVYAKENGLAVKALVTFAVSTKTPAAMEEAKRAATALLASHLEESGAVKREEKMPSDVRYLADAASLCVAFAALGKATGDAQWTNTATKMAQRMESAFIDASQPTGALFDQTIDADSVGVFSRRVHSFGPNVVAARCLTATGRVERSAQVLAALASDARLDDEGAWLGEFLMAATEAL